LVIREGTVEAVSVRRKVEEGYKIIGKELQDFDLCPEMYVEKPFNN
jgi:hypothetical protein